MHTLFAARHALTDPPDEAWRTCRAVARLAVGGERGGWPAGLAGDAGTWEPGDGSRAIWRTDAATTVGRLWTLSVDEPVDADRTLRRRTTTWVGEHDGTTSVQVAVELVAVSGGIRPLPSLATGAPGTLVGILERCTALDGARRLSPTPLVVDARTMGEATILATDPRRALPVVLVVRAGALARTLARALAGVAHVLDVTEAGAATLRAHLELDEAEPGTVDVLWSGWQLGDGAPQRSSWLRRSAVEPALAASPIVAAVAAAAAVRIEPPALAEQLRDEVVRARLAELPAPVAERDAADGGAAQRTVAGVDDDPGNGTGSAADEGSGGGSAAHEGVATIEAQWRHDLRALGDARRQVEDLRAAVTRAQGELDDVVALLSTRFDAEVAAAVAARSAARPGAPTTLGEALAVAVAELEHLVVLPEVVDQARRWPYQQPARVLADLRTLDAIAGRWKAGQLRQGLHAAALAAGLPWARDVSTTAHQLFGEDYTIRWGGHLVLLGPHLRYGSGPPTRQCRVYCAVLPADHVLIVGHIGAHLRGARDR